MTAAQILDRLFEGFANKPSGAGSPVPPGFTPMDVDEFSTYGGHIYGNNAGMICDCVSPIHGGFMITFGPLSSTGGAYVTQVFGYSKFGLDFEVAFSGPSAMITAAAKAVTARNLILSPELKTKDDLIAKLEAVGFKQFSNDKP